MTKNYPYILTINKSISTSKINDENKKTSIITTANENVRRHSKKLMAKLQKITSQTSVNNELNLLEISTPTTSQNTTPTECTPQTSVEESQLKSILKNSDQSNTHRNSREEIELDLSKLIKRVRFNEHISRRRYNANSPVSDLMKLSRRQLKKLRKLQRKDSFELQSMETNRDVLIFDQIDEDESSENDD